MQAVNLIRLAVQQGWTREIKSFHNIVMVILQRRVGEYPLISWAQIIVSFRRPLNQRGRGSVCVSTVNEYRDKGTRGLWLARYEVGRLQKRDAEWKR